MSEKDIALLEKLCLIPSAPGFENEVQKKLIQNYKRLGATNNPKLDSKTPCMASDNLGNLYAKFPGNPSLPSIAYLAHADSPAFMITAMYEEGFFSARPIGWKGCIDRRILAGSPVLIKGKGNELYPGAFTTKSIHLMQYGEEDFTEIERDIILDCGAATKEMLEDNGILVGNPVFLEPRFKLLLDYESCQATNLDDRVGTFTLLKTSKEIIKNNKERGDVYLVSTVSEEAEPQGSNLASRILKNKVDLALAIDGTVAVDYFFGDPEATYAEHNTSNALSMGPVFKKGGFKEEIFSNAIKKIAKRKKINFQIEADQTFMQTDELWCKMQGIPTSAILIPMRNLHTAIETIDTCDLEKAVRIAKELPYEIGENKQLKKYLKTIIKPN